LPGQGRYGAPIAAAINYILSTQRADGVFSIVAVMPGARFDFENTALYNHAIAGLTLCEAHGMSDKALAARIAEAIRKARQVSLKDQARRKPNPDDVG